MITYMHHLHRNRLPKWWNYVLSNGFFCSDVSSIGRTRYSCYSCFDIVNYLSDNTTYVRFVSLAGSAPSWSRRDCDAIVAYQWSITTNHPWCFRYVFDGSLSGSSTMPGQRPSSGSSFSTSLPSLPDTFSSSGVHECVTHPNKWTILLSYRSRLRLKIMFYAMDTVAGFLKLRKQCQELI